METIVYVDGFNLYYRMLKKSPQFKWLNLKVLAEKILDRKSKVAAINFYTARVSARIRDDAPRNQQVYLDALATIPEIECHFGNFQIKDAYAPIVEESSRSPIFLPIPQSEIIHPWPDVVRIVKIEEKGSDVNLAAHLIRDAFQGKFEVAAVITNDTDLVEPIRIATQELDKTVGILSPVSKPAKSLEKVASFVRHIRSGHLAAAQFPNPLPRSNAESLDKPLEWE